MNGTESRNFNHSKILTQIACPDLSGILENWLISVFLFVHSNTVKVSQKDQIRM